MDCGSDETADSCSPCHNPVIQQDLAPFAETGIREGASDSNIVPVLGSPESIFFYCLI